MVTFRLVTTFGDDFREDIDALGRGRFDNNRGPRSIYRGRASAAACSGRACDQGGGNDACSGSDRAEEARAKGGIQVQGPRRDGLRHNSRVYVGRRHQDQGWQRGEGLLPHKAEDDREAGHSCGHKARRAYQEMIRGRAVPNTRRAATRRALQPFLLKLRRLQGQRKRLAISMAAAGGNATAAITWLGKVICATAWPPFDL